MKNLITQTGLIVGLVTLLAGSAFAQVTPRQEGSAAANAPQIQAERRGRRGGMRAALKRRAGMRALERLNLSETQRQQLRDLRARNRESLTPQRQELRQLLQQQRGGTTLTLEQETRARELRAALQKDHEQRRAEILNILTPEQREQMKQMREAMKARREQMKARRQELRRQRSNQTPPQ